MKIKKNREIHFVNDWMVWKDLGFHGISILRLDWVVEHQSVREDMVCLAIFGFGIIIEIRST